jgi:hypothetical protein
MWMVAVSVIVGVRGVSTILISAVSRVVLRAAVKVVVRGVMHWPVRIIVGGARLLIAL